MRLSTLSSSVSGSGILTELLAGESSSCGTLSCILARYCTASTTTATVLYCSGYEGYYQVAPPCHATCGSVGDQVGPGVWHALHPRHDRVVSTRLCDHLHNQQIPVPFPAVGSYCQVGLCVPGCHDFYNNLAASGVSWCAPADFISACTAWQILLLASSLPSSSSS